MIVLWLLCAHLVGDYLLQTRWQANGKFGWTREAIGIRLTHVCTYTCAFVPVAAVYGNHYPDAGRVILFLQLLFIAHFLTDAQRFKSTPGDWIGWRFFLSPKQRADAYERVESVTLTMPPQPSVTSRPPDDVDRKLNLPANPWPSIGLAIDQTLHLIQIAVLAGWLLT